MSETTIKKKAEEGMEQYFFRASAENFKKIPGSPIAYWVSHTVREIFDKKSALKDNATLKHGLSTGNNERFIRQWREVSIDTISLPHSFDEKTSPENYEWFPYNKGGSFRRWYGNNDLVICYGCRGQKLVSASLPGFRHDGRLFYFRAGVTWSALSSSSLSVRVFPKGFVFADKGQCLFSESRTRESIASFLNSSIAGELMKILAPTLDFHSGYLEKIPFQQVAGVDTNAATCVAISSADWDSFETSWDFKSLPLFCFRFEKSDRGFSRSHAPAWECRPNPNDNAVGVPTLERGNQKFLSRPVSRGRKALSYEGQATDFDRSYCHDAGRRGQVVRHGQADQAF